MSETKFAVKFDAGYKNRKERRRLKARLDLPSAERDAAQSEVVRLRELINRDRTGLASALNGVRNLVRGWSWIGREEWGPYSYEDHTTATLQREWREFADQALTLIERALRESGDRANIAHSLHDRADDGTEGKGGLDDNVSSLD